MRICFYARVKDKSLFDIVEFYRVDIAALRQLGHEVICVNSFKELLRTPCELYYVWWFGYGVFPAMLARLRVRPSILTGAVHTQDCGSLNDWPIHKRWLMKLAMRLATRTLFISKTDFAKLIKFRASNPEVVYCAVDIAAYRPTEMRRKKNLVATVTHLTKENVARKRLLDAIEAFAQFSRTFPDYEYHIAGSFGDAVEDVRAKIRDCAVEGRVFLKGRISDQEKIELLQRARAYLQPSTCEGFGLAILEAKACGTPVVTSREPCIVEINGDSVVYGETVAELADGLARLAADEKYFDEMVRRGLDNVTRYSAEARKEALRNVLVSVGF